MPKKKKDDFDAAHENKAEYIKSNYLVQEDEQEEPSLNKNRVIIVSMMCILLVSLIGMFYWTYFIPKAKINNQQVLEAAVITPEATLSPTLFPATPTPIPTLSKYDEYKDIYPDIVGWISIENIKVDYPVVQSPDPADPFKYLDLSPDEKSSKHGAIFLDIRNSSDASDRHTIIYGHNMKDGSMFGQLNMYLKRTFFNDHLIIRYDTLYQELEWEVFNVFITDTDFYYIETYFDSDEQFVNLIQQCVYKSYYHDNQTVISPEDRILTLSTCTNKINDGRLVVQARLITPLEEDETETAIEWRNTNQ